MYPITKAQKRCLDALKKLMAENGGYSPTFHELAAELGITYGSARALAKNLAARGRVDG